MIVGEADAASRSHGLIAGEGGTWLLDLVAAVDHLRRGIRPGITVWDAIEEAPAGTPPPPMGSSR